MFESPYSLRVTRKINNNCVESSSKLYLDGGEFDHLVAYSLVCMFENEIMSVRKYESICFGSINEVIDEDGLECLNNEKA